MRADTTMGSTKMSSIYDVDAQKLISINHSKKEAEIINMADFAKDLQKVSAADISVNVTPTSRTKVILGRT